MILCSKLFLRSSRKRIFAIYALFFFVCSSKIFAQNFAEIIPESKSYEDLAPLPSRLTFDSSEFAKPIAIDRQNKMAGISLSVLQSTVPLDVGSLVELSAKAKAYRPTQVVVKDQTKSPTINTTAAVLEKKDIKSAEVVEHEVVVSIQDGVVSFTPSTISVNRESVKNVSLRFTDSSLVQKVGVFSRNNKVAVWNEGRNSITIKGSGKTEVFIASQSFMGILPIEVTDKAAALVQLNPSDIKTPAKKDLFGLEIPDSLTSLDMNIQPTRASLGTSTSLEFSPEMTAMQSPTTLADSSIHLTKKVEKASTVTATFRFVDERSNMATKQYFGVGGLAITIGGTEFKALTDQLGVIQVRDIPKGSRFLIHHYDPNGKTVTGIFEAQIEADVSQEIIVPVRRQFSLQENLNTLGVQLSDNQKGTFCGQAIHSKQNAMSLADIAVTLDVQARGPFYVNPYGFFDGKLFGTGADGYFCFFDVERGPVNVSFFSKQTYLGSAVALVDAQRHTEEKFYLGERQYLQTHLFLAGGAADQLNSNRAISNRRTPVDMANIMAIGTGDLFTSVDEGVIKSNSSLLSFKGNVYSLSQSGEFEDILYKNRINEPSQNQYLTLYPRGYIEDMSVYAQSYQDPSLGSVIAEHASLDGQGLESPEMHLVDAYGRDVGEGWTFADGDLSKAIFFNVPYGVYTLTVHTKDGNWIAADTVVVYSGVSSYLRTGSRSIVKSDQLSAAN